MMYGIQIDYITNLNHYELFESRFVPQQIEKHGIYTKADHLVVLLQFYEGIAIIPT